MGVTCETSVELDFEGSPVNITLFHNFGENTTGSLFIPLKLVIIIPPPAEGNVQTLAMVIVKARYFVFKYFYLLEKGRS